MINVLVLPSGSEIGLEIHDALVRRRDLNLFGAESTHNSHAAFVFARNFHVPHVSEEGFVAEVRALAARHSIDHIFPAHDDVQLALLQAGESLGCPVVSSPLETVELTRYKTLTYEALHDVMRVPRVYDAVRLERSDFPVFVKPDRGQGSQDSHLCVDDLQLQLAMRTRNHMVVCEHLPGREVTVDCFSDRERGLLFVDPRLRARIRAGISVRSEPIALPQARRLAECIGERLRLYGAWFFQLKQDAAGEWVLLEVGARIPGGATYQRMRGVNLPLLSLFEQQRRYVDIRVQPFDVVMDRAFRSRFRMNFRFDSLHVDFDDALSLRGRPNPDLVALIVLCRNLGKEVVLLSRNGGDCHDWLARHRLSALFDRIDLIDRESPKTDYIAANGLLIDDSFAERIDCEAAGILCLDVDCVPALVQQLQRDSSDE